MRQTLIRIALFSAITGCGPVVFTGGTGGTTGPVASAITNGDQLINAMHARYDGRWYNTITFVQKSTYYRVDGSVLRSETWYEGAQLPGRLRIDMGSTTGGTGVLYRADSTYQLQGGRITGRRWERNQLLVLGFDVYTQSTNRTKEQVRLDGFNAAVLHVDTLDGRRVYVVGAAKGDTTTNQFWVDAQRLLFVRAIITQNNQTRDIRFQRYTQYGGGWVAEVVRVYSGGTLRFLEEYSQVRVNEQLDENLFVPERWSSATHWYRP
jgi:hypothetical protein